MDLQSSFMKKLICYRQPEVFGLGTEKGRAFQQSNPDVNADAGQLASIETQQETSLEGQNSMKDIQAVYEAGINAINAFTDTQKVAWGDDETKAEHDAALEAAKTAALNKWKEKQSEAENKFGEDAKIRSLEMADELAKARAAEKKYPEGSLDKISVFGNWAEGDNRVKYVENGEVKTQSENAGNFRYTLQYMLQAVYVAEGKEAAQRLFDTLKNNTRQQNNSNNLAKSFGLDEGLNPNSPVITFEGDNDEGRRTRGVLWGYMHAANSLFGKDKAGQDAKKEYFEYLGIEGRKSSEAYGDANKKMLGDLQTPEQWVRVHKKPADSLISIKEGVLQTQKNAFVDSYIAKHPYFKDHGAQEIRGVLMGFLKSCDDESTLDEAEKQIEDAVHPRAVGQYSEAIKKFFDKEDEVFPNKYSGDKRENQSLGYVYGLMLRAEETYKAKPYLLAAYKAKLKEVTNSDAWGKLENAENGFKAAVGLLPTPEGFEGARKVEKPQESFVDDMLKKLDADSLESLATRDYIRGILIGAIGKETDPAKMEERGNAALKEAGVTTGTDENGIRYDTSGTNRNLMNDILGKEANDKIDSLSKGLLTGMMLLAKEQFKNNPGDFEAYKKHLKAVVTDREFQTKMNGNLNAIDQANKEYENAGTDSVKKEKAVRQITALRQKVYDYVDHYAFWPDHFQSWFNRDALEKNVKANMDFVDAYGDKAQKPAAANAALNTIFNNEDLKDELKDDPKKEKASAVAKKKAELVKKIEEGKSPEARLAILAAAQAWVENYPDNNAESETKTADDYTKAAALYHSAERIIKSAKSREAAGKYLQERAKALGYKKLKKNEQYQQALEAVKAADPKDRQKILAQQIIELEKGAEAGKKPAFFLSLEDFNAYGKVIEEKMKPKESEEGHEKDGGKGNKQKAAADADEPAPRVSAGAGSGATRGEPTAPASQPAGSRQAGGTPPETPPGLPTTPGRQTNATAVEYTVETNAPETDPKRRSVQTALESAIKESMRRAKEGEYPDAANFKNGIPAWALVYMKNRELTDVDLSKPISAKVNGVTLTVDQNRWTVDDNNARWFENNNPKGSPPATGTAPPDAPQK